MTLKIITKFHCLVFATAVLVGILYVTPQLLIRKNLHGLNKPYVIVQLTHHSDEAYGGVSRFREIYDGHFIPGDLHFDANSPSPLLSMQFPFLIMAGLMYLFRGSVNQAYLTAYFLAPSILFLLFFFLGKVLSRNNLWSFFLGLVGVFTPIFKHLPYAFQNLDNFLNVIIKNFYPLVNTPLDTLFLSRMMDPLLTYLIYVPAIFSLLLFWKKPNTKTAILTAVLVGLMTYTYFHYWVYLVIVTGLILVFTFLTRKENLNRFKSALLLIGVLFFIVMPYLVNFFIFNSSASANEAAQRIGITAGRYFHLLKPFPVIFDYVFYSALAGLVYFVFWKKHNTNLAVLYWIFIGAMFIVWNVQLAIGYVPQPDHWFRVVSPFIFIILFNVLYELSKKINYKTVAVVLVILCSLLVVKKIVNAVIFINPPAQLLKDYTFNSDIVDSWDWINRNLAREPKIISPSFVTSLYLVSQTAARPYLATGFNSMASNEILEGRFLRSHKVFSTSPDFLFKLLKADKEDFCEDSECEFKDFHREANLLENSTYLYGQYYKKQKGDAQGGFRRVPIEQVEKLVGIYNNMEVKWKDLEADYVYYGPWEKDIVRIDLSREKDLVPIYRNSEVEIYRIQK